MMLILPTFPAKAFEYPWVFLIPNSSSYDSTGNNMDEAVSRNTVAILNQKEPLFNHHLIWKKVTIKNLLSMGTPFCEMHFDAVIPCKLDSEEKSIIEEYLKRGGFILLVIDTCRYSEEEYWNVKEWPIMNFLTHDLPASDHSFSTGKASENFPIFRLPYQFTFPDFIRHEFSENPYSPVHTQLFYQNRLCCFVLEFYSSARNRRDNAYQLLVNIYTYSVMN